MQACVHMHPWQRTLHITCTLLRSPVTQPRAQVAYATNKRCRPHQYRAAQPKLVKYDAGQGAERKESRRRRGGRGKRSHEDSLSESSHRKPPSPKLADLIMPALKAKEKAQSEALERQRGSSCAPQESTPAPAACESTMGAGDGNAEGSAAGEATPAEPPR